MEVRKTPHHLQTVVCGNRCPDTLPAVIDDLDPPVPFGQRLHDGMRLLSDDFGSLEDDEFTTYWK